MQVSVRGARDRSWAHLFRKAARFYAKELMHQNLVNNLYLEIKFIGSSKNFPDKGQCEWADHDGPPNPRYFTIFLAKCLSKKDALQTLAHEMVHLKQFAKNEMTGLIYPSGLYMWKGADYKLNSKFSPARKPKNMIMCHPKGADYYYQPWEVEAYGLEVGLWAYFTQQSGIE